MNCCWVWGPSVSPSRRPSLGDICCSHTRAQPQLPHSSPMDKDTEGPPRCAGDALGLALGGDQGLCQQPVGRLCLRHQDPLWGLQTSVPGPVPGRRPLCAVCRGMEALAQQAGTCAGPSWACRPRAPNHEAVPPWEASINQNRSFRGAAEPPTWCTAKLEAELGEMEPPGAAAEGPSMRRSRDQCAVGPLAGSHPSESSAQSPDRFSAPAQGGKPSGKACRQPANRKRPLTVYLFVGVQTLPSAQHRAGQCSD